nr:PREDICTED: enhancer of filamentation 1 isoform X1 [Lepisosteus oculatus]XP_015213207.1 PREDICTED: enhancer of filamentation 1 isoform X1 [Lepisosteus oculatus]
MAEIGNHLSVPNIQCSNEDQNLMAKALYDNIPESPEELEFRKGDVLTVIEQNTGGLEGWWLCSLYGRQGIAPGNRLKLLIGPLFDGQSPSQQPQIQTPMSQAYQQPGYSTTPSQSPALMDSLYQVPPSHQNQQGIYQVPPSYAAQPQDVYQVPPSVQRGLRAAEGPCKVVTPTRVGNTYAYETPSQYQKDVYDVPPIRPQGVYDIPPGKQMGPMFPGRMGEPRTQGVYDIPPAVQGVYSIPPSALKEKEGNYDFPPPMKLKAEGVYDIPPTALSKSSGQSNYDFPPNSDLLSHSSNGIYDIPPAQMLGSQLGSQRDVYDIPRGMQPPGKQRGTMDRMAGDRGKGVYDIPPQVSQESKTLHDMTDGINRLSISSTGSTRSNMSTSSTTSKESSISNSPVPENKLLLDLDTAIQRNAWLQRSVEVSILGLMGYTSPNWRSYDYMEKHMNEIRAAIDKVKQSLADFLNFSKGAVANASGLSDLTLHNKLKKQLQRLEDSSQILSQTSRALDACSWSLNMLVTNKAQSKSDDLDRFLMVSRTVPDDVKQLSSSISTNAEHLFKRAPNGSFSNASREESSPTDYIYNSPQPQKGLPNIDETPNSNGSEQCVKSWMEDYDYVHLQGKEEFERQQKELLEKENIIKQNKIQLEQEQLNQFKQLEKEVIKPVENDISTWSAPQSLLYTNGGLCTKDKQLLFFYSEQCETHFVTLLNAIDAFFSCISAGQPPRIFVAHSKFVILSAHKLVFIGDTLSRQAATLEIRNKVMDCSNLLCENLKTVVAATKMAALHYPSTAAVQEMVDQVTGLSHQAQQFKVQLVQMASL